MLSWNVYVMRPAACSALSAVSMTPSHGSSILEEYAATTVSGAAAGLWATAAGKATEASPSAASVADKARPRRVIGCSLSPFGHARVAPSRRLPFAASCSRPVVVSSYRWVPVGDAVGGCVASVDILRE